LKQRTIMTAMTKRFSMQHFIRLGIIAAVLVCLLMSFLFSNVTVKKVHAQVPEADLAISKTVDPFEVIAGEYLLYHIYVVNHGPDPAINALVWDVLPEGVTYVSDTDNG